MLEKYNNYKPVPGRTLVRTKTNPSACVTIIVIEFMYLCICVLIGLFIFTYLWCGDCIPMFLIVVIVCVFLALIESCVVYCWQ